MGAWAVGVTGHHRWLAPDGAQPRTNPLGRVRGCLARLLLRRQSRFGGVASSKWLRLLCLLKKRLLQENVWQDSFGGDRAGVGEEPYQTCSKWVMVVCGPDHIHVDKRSSSDWQNRNFSEAAAARDHMDNVACHRRVHPPSTSMEVA
jgi:hypothetical protein